MSIKLEHVVLARPEQMEFIIEGMRNPMNSWEKSDSYAGHENMGAGNEYFKRCTRFSLKSLRWMILAVSILWVVIWNR